MSDDPVPETPPLPPPTDTLFGGTSALQVTRQNMADIMAYAHSSSFRRDAARQAVCVFGSGGSSGHARLLGFSGASGSNASFGSVASYMPHGRI
jgi:hypothetical protein